MAREKSPVHTLFDDIVKRSVTCVLKPIGFRKSGLNFHRRHKDVVQVVNLQSSQGSTWGDKLFYVNVGLAFDALCQLTATEILEKPKVYDCDSRGTRDRLENLLAKTPDRWTIKVGGDSQLVAQQLQKVIEQLAAELEKIEGVQTYREHHWFNRFRPKQENAQILYVLGGFDAAWQEVQDLCKLFADRRAINRPEWWINKLGLTKLASKIDEN